MGQISVIISRNPGSALSANQQSDVTLTASDTTGALRATVEVTEYLGDDALLNLRVGPHELIAQVPAANRPANDASIHVTFNAAGLHLFDAATGSTLLS